MIDDTWTINPNIVLQDGSPVTDRALIGAVNRAKSEGATSLARTFLNLKRMKEELDALIKPITEQLEYVKGVALPEAYEAEGVTSMKVDGMTVYKSENVRASINKDAKDDAYQWLRDNGWPDLIQETVNASSLASVARGIMSPTKERDPETGEERIIGAGKNGDIFDMPDSLFNVYIQPTMGSRKS